ncbi:type I methionyl aminopeptidase [Candidatus Kaiserbacteria bacterium RIFCSPHIGHO2_02_FULL_50_50]|uniref:Methionine aminopeptidase n=1 Tax=Candidatus Kaiserbacteria bacterium RIFCSPHIGHO2_02_FULL_50_50 TaxID=1798492 RepID=A0A1F6DET4_9BACT|nr:MAG: type I methionyl aminopeptidase [Candidatus Kaiserbacteria bacterium RIFCSPHIGHO2_02_FULL_50_50]OGG89250.1 MAG: type I methionyl aminopeptidase [Candidatus Kaiserbacteria bacterium RIFCSPLOWO2_12_FULL_50_10]
MITKKKPEEIERLRKGGRILARILRETKEYAKPGMSTGDLEVYAHGLTLKYGVEPTLLGYHPVFADFPYPACMCISVNDTVQHGVPRDDEILADGDIINLDMSIGYEGMIVDSGITFGLGTITQREEELLKVTREALKEGIKAAKPGNRIGDISHAIETYIRRYGLGIVEDLAGHGVGYKNHEEPMIPNLGKAGTGPAIQVGHVYAIEPITTIGSPDVLYDDEGDGYSIFTADGSKSAHFEHTVVITEKGAEIMTQE